MFNGNKIITFQNFNQTEMCINILEAYLHQVQHRKELCYKKKVQNKGCFKVI